MKVTGQNATRIGTARTAAIATDAPVHQDLRNQEIDADHVRVRIVGAADRPHDMTGTVDLPRRRRRPWFLSR
ncbi:MAG TPA: hypothetical protein VMP11_15215 [Verrucomicrobiae bacterium]|nr:hypothetical protein [Verrucomicrobiae bacterium]